MAQDILPHERRDYFRVHHNVLFDYKNVDVHAIEGKSPVRAMGAESEMALVAALQHIDREALASLKLVAQKDRLLGDYLNRLNQKIDLIARHSVFAGAEQRQSKSVSLSEGGLAFDCDRVLYKGNLLVVRMIFLPSYTPVVVFARVTRCDAEGAGFRAAVEFHQLNEQDRQMLAREILKAQVSHRKRLSSLEKTDDQAE